VVKKKTTKKPIPKAMELRMNTKEFNDLAVDDFSDSDSDFDSDK